MDIHTLYALVGFMLAAYAVIGNDSVQTLGTFIASNTRVIKWYWLWLAASSVMIFTLVYGWHINEGDISYGRLDKIPPIEIQWYHAAAPAVLVILTRIGIPVSTTFLVLSVFASTVVLEKVLVKSVIGYGVAAIVAYSLWMILGHFINEKFNTVKKGTRTFWRTAQWLSTGFLWFTWLSHDLANIAVFLPREVPLLHLMGALTVLTGWLGFIFYTHGGKIQKIVLEKTGARYIRSATIIDFSYAIILLYFKELNNIPMSTTWVFVGLLTGRELAIATVHRADYKFGYVFPLVGKDFGKMILGLLVSVALVLSIHSLAPSSDKNTKTNINYLHDIDTFNKDEMVNTVIEIPAGSNEKWEFSKSSGTIEQEYKNGKPRIIQFLPYPSNYGMIPQTTLPKEVGGDGDPLDVIVLGPALDRETIASVNVIGVLKLVDKGEMDDKIIAISENSPLATARSLDEMKEKFPNVLHSIETWFESYKGPNIIKSHGYMGKDEALRIIENSHQYYKDSQN